MTDPLSGKTGPWLAMSAGQAALWFEQEARPGSNAYNLAMCVRFAQPLDLPLLQDAIRQVGARHPLLTARCALRDEGPCWQADAYAIELQRMSAAPCDAPAATALATRFLLKPYALAKEPLVRVGVWPLNGGGVLLALGCHHIAADLHSAAVVLQELESTFAGAVVPAKASPPAGYHDFCEQQAAERDSDRARRAQRFWAAELASHGRPVPVLPVRDTAPGDAPRGAGRLTLRLPHATVAEVTAAAARAGTHPVVVWLTTFQAVLAHHLGVSRVITAMPTSGRGGRRFDDVVGYFVNLLPLVYDHHGDERFQCTLQRQAVKVARALRHHRLPYAQIVSLQRRDADTLQHGVAIDASFSYQTTSREMPARLLRLALGLEGGGLLLGAQLGTAVPLPEPQAQFPLGLTLAPCDEGVLVALQFDRDHTSAEHAQRLLDDWLRWLQAGLQRPQDSFHQHVRPKPEAAEPVSLHAAVRAALSRHAQRVALKGPTGSIRYAELDDWVQALAGELAASGVRPRDRVAVLGGGGPDSVAAMLAAWCCGAAFVPVDLQLPAPRARVQLERARVAAVVVCDEAAPAWVQALDVPVLTGGRRAASTASIPPPAQPGPLDPAWLMFTSGSTGEPKAAVVPQEAALLHAQAMAQRLKLTPKDRVLQFSSLSFDEHAEEIFPSLIAGACVVLRPGIRCRDPLHLLQQAQRAGVTVLHLPTAYWHVWMLEARTCAWPLPSRLRLVNVGGEPASPQHLITWAELTQGRGIAWINSYGLTEAAVTSLVYEWAGDLSPLRSLDAVPVGRPIDGTCVRIVDAQGRQVPTGATGELWLGGKGVGLGYFDQPTATLQRFWREPGLTGQRWLRTGDLARIDAAGEVVLIGRQDATLKVRGVRVDPHVVEAVVRQQLPVADAVVVAVGERGYDLHVAPRAAGALDEAALRTWWLEALPEVPAPARVHLHAAIPQTPGMKPDFALLRQWGARVQTPPSAPSSDDALTRAVASVFAELLGRPSVGDADNFFLSGGDSLLALRVVARVRRTWAVDFDIADFLEDPTPAAVARRCRQRPRKASESPTVSLPVHTRYPLSRAQQRAMWLERDVGAETRRSVLLRLPDGLDTIRIEQALQQVVARHPLLTAEINEAGNLEHPRPPASGVVLRPLQIDLPPNVPGTRLARLLRAACEAQPTTDAPVEAIVVVAGSQRYLALRARFTAVDGGALALLIDDLVQTFEAPATPSMPGPRYFAVVEAERAWLASDARAAAQAHWRAALQDAPVAATLPMMAQSEGTGDMRSRRIRWRVAPARARQLQALASLQASSPSAVLLAAFAALVSRHLGEPEVLIGLPVSLRGVWGLGEVVGPSLNPLPWRSRVDPQASFVTLLQQTRDRLAQALRHAALPVEEIAAATGLHMLRSGPLPIQFVVQPAQPDRRHGIWPLRERDGQCPVALQVNVTWDRDPQVEFEYQCRVLSDTQAMALLRRYRVLLAGLLATPQQPVSEIAMQPRHQVARWLHWCPPWPEASAALLHEALACWARRSPKRTALVCGDTQLSYQALDRLADHHAARLVAQGVRVGDRVLVYAPGGVDEVVGVLATLRAGAAYVPLSRDLPPARMMAIAGRVGARAVIGAAGLGEGTTPALPGLPAVVVDLQPEPALPFCPPTLTGDATAYILFTSGTTGEPKGVEVSHRAARVTLQALQQRFALSEDDVFFGTASLGFDLSVFDLFATIAVGACLVRPASSTPQPEAWAAEVERHRVSVWNSVPAGLALLLQAGATGGQSLASLRLVLVSGDWVPLGLPAQARQQCPHARFVALGGATEAAIWSNCQEVEQVDPAWSSIPYGRALRGHALYVLEPGGWPAPPGTPGEICLGGDGLAKGYWASPELTAERFVHHRQSDRRIYRTGDLGRYRDDGVVEILGRIDRQVKLRGWRVEPAAVEAVLARVPGVQRAIVQPFGPPRAPRGLVAYLLPTPGAVLSIPALRERARAELPEPLRPSHYLLVAEVPLGANGKLDMSRLPPLHEAAAEPSIAAETLSTAEQQLVMAWTEVLPGSEPLTRADQSFFAQGGDSLQAVRLLGKVQQRLGWQLPLAQWLVEPTFHQLLRLGRQCASEAVLTAGETRRSTARLAQHVRLDPYLKFRLQATHSGQHVFITGASGLIGTQVAMQWLRQTSQTLWCLVRPGGERRLKDRLAELGATADMRQRVSGIEGDLALPLLGFGPREFEAVAARAGQLLHLGAQVDLMADYDRLEAVNVQGTQQVIGLAARAGAHLHHVSSVGVLPYGAGRLATESDSIDVDGPLSTGYCETKWVAEQLVRAAMREGLRATIYRPGLTVSGGQALPSSGLLIGLLLLAREVGAVPAVEVPLDLVTAEYAAAALCHIARQPSAAGGTFHLTHPEPLSLQAWLASGGTPLSQLPRLDYETWRQRLIEVLPSLHAPGLAPLAALIASTAEAQITPATIDCANTQAHLSATQIRCEPVAEILQAVLQSLQASATPDSAE